MKVFLLVIALLVSASLADRAPLFPVEDSIEGSYIIKFKDDTDVDSAVQDLEGLVRQHRLRATFSRRYYHVMKGTAADLSDGALEFVRSLHTVEYVCEDGVEYADAAVWGLDRINQVDLPLDGVFDSDDAYAQGNGVEVWVVDTGILPTHLEFNGRASVEFDAFGGDGIDCHGHGTHCAGTAAGYTFGVAKLAWVRGVKVLGTSPCSGSGTTSSIVAGLDYVVAHATKPAVISYSIGGSKSTAKKEAFDRVYAAGIQAVVSAGNDDYDACNKSPAWIDYVITVGSIESDDDRSSFSNYGSCVDIFAPGSSILSASYESDTAIAVKSGTSMATPHVAGTVALHLSSNPTMTPDQVMAAIKATGTQDTLTDIGTDSPNLLVYVEPK